MERKMLVDESQKELFDEAAAVSLGKPSIPIQSEGVGAETDDVGADNYSFSEADGTESSLGRAVKYRMIPLTALQGKMRTHEPDAPRSSWKDVTSGQKNAIDAINNQTDTSGVLIRCRNYNPELTDVVSARTFARQVATGIDCLHYTEFETMSGNQEFAWVVKGMGDADLRQLLRTTSLQILVQCWGVENGHNIDRVTYDGGAVLEDGTTVESPYSLDEMRFSNH